MEATKTRRENLTWPDENKTHEQLEVIRELAKELRTDYPTDTPDEPTNWSNEARNRRNAYIRAQFVTDENGINLHLLTGSEWLELFDMLGFSVDKETRKRFASHLNWYSFWYADFKPRLSSKYAQRIHWYVYNFLFCLRNKLQTEKDYREGKYGSKGQAYFIEIEQQSATPTETPLQSTQTAETVNASVDGEKEAERAENIPERKIKYFHYTPEQLKRYIIDVYEKYANGEWVLQPHEQKDTDAGLWDVVGGKIGYWTNWRREKFSEVNMDFNSPTCHACYKINRTYQKDDFIVSNEKLLEFTIGGNYYYIQKQTYSKGKHRWCYTIMDAHGDFAVNDFSYTKRGILQRFNKWWKKNATIIWRSSEFAPQSTETPQTGECTADTPKPRETGEKRQNRTIGGTHRSGLGANGYAMLDNAGATLAAINVSRECSTAEAACW